MIYLIPLLIVLFFMSVKVVQEYDRGVIFFLGRCTGVRGPGLIILIPILERMQQVSLRTITMGIPSQKIITKDNVSIDIAAVAKALEKLVPHPTQTHIIPDPFTVNLAGIVADAVLCYTKTI